MKATKQSFPKVLFIMFYKVGVWMKSYSVTIQMKATEQYFPVMLYKAVLTSECVVKILKCDY